jgi:hypothetical protein
MGADVRLGCSLGNLLLTRVGGCRESIQSAADIPDGKFVSKALWTARNEVVVFSSSPSPDLFAGLPSRAARHFVVDANGVLAVIALYDQDSLPAFQSGGYESADGTVKLLVSALGLLQSYDFEGKRKPRAWEQSAASEREGSAGFRFMQLVGHKSSFTRSTGVYGPELLLFVSCRITRLACAVLPCRTSFEAFRSLRRARGPVGGGPVQLIDRCSVVRGLTCGCGSGCLIRLTPR